MPWGSILGLLKLIPLTTWLFAGVFGIAALIVNNHFDAQNKVVAGYVQQVKDKDILIHNQQEQIAGLQIDKNSLMVSNKSLEIHIGSLQETIDRVIDETRRILNSDEDFARRQAALDKLIADEVRQDRIEAVRNSRKASLLLNYINSNTECWIANFDKIDGTCIQGIWRPEANGPK